MTWHRINGETFPFHLNNVFDWAEQIHFFTFFDIIRDNMFCPECHETAALWLLCAQLVLTLTMSLTQLCLDCWFLNSPTNNSTPQLYQLYTNIKASVQTSNYSLRRMLKVVAMHLLLSIIYNWIHKYKHLHSMQCTFPHSVHKCAESVADL